MGSRFQVIKHRTRTAQGVPSRPHSPERSLPQPRATLPPTRLRPSPSLLLPPLSSPTAWQPNSYLLFTSSRHSPSLLLLLFNEEVFLFICRLFYPTVTCTFFSYGTFSRIYHMLGHQLSVSRFKNVESYKVYFSIAMG